MKLRRLYSNRSAVFGPIPFRDGLNVVMGEIRRPENRAKDTHNLGKTILSQVIDFCLLRQKHPGFFLFKHEDRFANFVFFLEVETDAGGFITIRRSVERGSKASFKRHTAPGQDFTETPEANWDHWEAAFDTARSLLDGLLGLTAIAPWSFRRAIAYSLRSQSDYDTPFKLAKYGPRHIDWKPLLAHILGLDGELFKTNYDLLGEIAEAKATVERQRAESMGIDNLDQLRGLIDIRTQEVARIEQQVERYDFELADADINRELVDELDVQIADLNQQRYYFDTARKRTEAAIRVGVIFNLDEIKDLFEQSQVYFADQLTKDYDDLVRFNKSITAERNAYLAEELKTLRAQIVEVNAELSRLNTERSSALVVLNDHDAMARYRRLNERLVESMATLETLRRQEEAVESIAQSRRHVSTLQEELNGVHDALEANIAAERDRYTTIKRHFNDVVARVIDDETVANLYVSPNTEGNPEFHADLVDKTGKITGEAEGHSYGQLLCIAFDMAVQHAYASERYPHFVYHDGILESLDDRKKLNLIDVVREWSEYGYQHIVTVIDSELPRLANGTLFEFDAEEVILTLHDEGDAGRLFRMPAW